ncbi:MAG: HAD-IIB family hydrolase [Candidatus Daviesbacteria bacterium]|nr:HAD-IIB family hydrolase [Candidatus Daviesbacteria bacterium]
MSIESVLTSELKNKAQGRTIQIVSDFDETLCSTYVFSDRWNTHVPKIRTDLVLEARKLTNPICIATARTPAELVSWVIWNKLSRLPVPLVAENGAILMWPLNRVTQLPEIKILASDEQIQKMTIIQRLMETGAMNDFQLPDGHEIVLRPGRTATVEIRAQEIASKKGTPDDYVQIVQELKSILSDSLSFIDIVSSGSSLGIQPKGISKEVGIIAALEHAVINMEDVFLIGLGDNSNDKPMFDFVKRRGGITIGVRNTTEGLCDLTFNEGDEVSLQLLKIVNNL